MSRLFHVRFGIVLGCATTLAVAQSRPDIRSVPADLTVPPLSEGPPAAGKRVALSHPDWKVEHILFLPQDWKPGTGRRFPVLVELPGNGGFRNRWGDECTGRPEGCKLGYGISGGKGYLWVSLPFINAAGDGIALNWWGDRPGFDPEPTVNHIRDVVPWICETFGGDPARVILTGFSRGAIACNFIGLHDDEIAKLWRAFVPYSHYDGVRQWPYPGSDRASALERLNRLRGRPQFICHEGNVVEKTRTYLESTGEVGFHFASTGFRNHNDAWVLRPSETRDQLRRWLKNIVDAPTAAEQIPRFKLPEGFEVQLVLSDPEIGQPMNLSFDARGRLWVSSSIEYPFPARGDGVQPRPDRFEGVGDHAPRDWITVASEIGSDGKPGRIERAVRGLNIPIGQTPLGDGDSAIVYGIPAISRIDDGERRALFGSFGNEDTHGMASSFRPWIDGWVYGCHGFRNTSTITDGSGAVTELFSGNTFRFRPDGSRFEVHTEGQVNPFGLTFDPFGNLFAADCHSRPIYQLLRGASYFRPDWAKPIADPLGLAPEMIDHDHGSTGICGPLFYAADHFPEEYRNGIFLCNPVTGRVHFDALEKHGTTLRARTRPDFITTDDTWFRPVDLALGPDGALYLADFCNPIIGHYEQPLDHPDRDRIHGRVWRVIYGEAPPAPPDLTKHSPAELLEFLESPNLTLRTLATNLFVENHAGSAVLVAAEFPRRPSPEFRAHALWILERLGRFDVALLGNEKEELVLTQAMKILADRGHWTEAEHRIAEETLRSGKGFARRAAVEAIVQHPEAAPPEALSQAHEDAVRQGDTHLDHLLKMALREHLLVNSHWPKQAPRTAFVARVAATIPTEVAAEFAVAVLSRETAGPDALTVIEAIHRGGHSPPELRTWAREVIPPLLNEVPEAAELAALLRLDLTGDLVAALPGKEGVAAARALLVLSPEQAIPRILERLRDAPAGSQRQLALTLATSPAGRAPLLEAIETQSAPIDLLRDDSLVRMLGRSDRLTRLVNQLPDREMGIGELIRARHEGFRRAQASADAGKRVFQAFCAACHRIGETGGNLGPGLAGIGSRGLRRLLEDILDPHRNVDPAFSVTTITTSDGTTISGIGARVEDDRIVITDATGQQHRIPVEKVETREDSRRSLMPAELAAGIPEPQFHDLIAYLLSTGDR